MRKLRVVGRCFRRGGIAEEKGRFVWGTTVSSRCHGGVPEGTHCRQRKTCSGWPCCWSSRTIGRHRCSPQNCSCWRAAVARHSTADWPCRSRAWASSVSWDAPALDVWMRRAAGCGGGRRTCVLAGGGGGLGPSLARYPEARS